MALLAIAVFGLFLEYLEYRNNEQTPLTVLLLGVAEDIGLFCITLATLLYVLAARPDRTKLVRAITISTLAIMGTATFFEIRRSMIHPTDFLGNPITWGDPSYWACRSALLAHAVLVTLPLLVIPMRLAESARIALGCWVLYIALVLTFAQPTPLNFLKFGFYAAVLPIPAVLFSWWRYSRFDASFERRELRGRYRELSAELLQARRLHEALLPQPLRDGPAHVAFVYEPMRQIGGDLVYVRRVTHRRPDTNDDPQTESTYIVLIDVSGHGVPAALAVNRLHGELERVFRSADPARPLSAGDVITALNGYVHYTLSDQGVFATGLCLRIEAHRTGARTNSGSAVFSPAVIEWANAGHPPAFVRSGGPSGKLHHLGSTAIMLGVLSPDEFEHDAQRLPAVPGDIVIAYTDGLPETRGHAAEEFGIERIEQMIQGHGASVITPSVPGEPGAVAPATDPLTMAPAIATALMQAATRHRHGPVQDDTLIVEVSLTAWTTLPSRERAAHADAATSSR